MYDELVKRLKRCTSDTVEDCDGCPYQGGYKGTYCMNGLIEEAADAIEAMSKLADAIPHVCECCVGCELEKKNGGCDNAFVLSPKRAMQYLIKPLWIPVTDRLPENGAEVLAWSESGFSYVDWWIDGEWKVNGLVDGKYEHATHWMPLPPSPEPPKEET